MKKKFRLTILGSNAAMPAFGRMTSCQALNYNDNYFLIDAGEGAQIRMSEYKVKRNRLKCIFISHLHGDHVFGLPGILTSYNHYNRTTPLRLYGPTGIKTYVEAMLNAGQTILRFDLEIVELDHVEAKVVWQSHDLAVTAFPLKHRIATYGYRFDEQLSAYNIISEKIADHQLTIDEIKQVKSGQNIRNGNAALKFTDLVYPRDEPRSYAYCSDTIYDETIVQTIQNVTTLYHETTYTSEFDKEAKERFHTTGKQAAQIAKLAGANTLITGHYSSRYRHGEEPYQEAKSYFDNTLKGYDGLIHDI